MNATGGLAVGVAGLGAVGRVVARALVRGAVPGVRLAAVSARDPATVAERIGSDVPVVAFAQLAARCDVVLEALPAAHFEALARAAIERGRIFVPLTVSALLEPAADELIARARATGARIVVPSGALLGLDGVRAAAEGRIDSVAMETRKPPNGLVGAPYLAEHGIVLEGLRDPLRVFAGSAREGARGFPANVNVAAALSLAGIGPDRTRLEIWADPGVTRNTHRITVESDSTRFSLLIEGVPAEENPRTGKLTALSALAVLRGLVAPLRIGS